MKQQLESIRLEAEALLKETHTTASLEELRINFLGKKGKLTGVLRGMGALSAEERPVIGQLANEVRAYLENAIEEAKTRIHNEERKQQLAAEKLDITMPGKKIELGHVHPLTQVLNEMKKVFMGMGFSVVEGPEVELDYYTFEALNMPPHHPARDTQDTFYINDSVILRTQTSSVQVRTMEKMNPPIRIICPGRIYRSDEIDATHSPIFYQVEGLVVDKGITMGDLIGTLREFAKAIFGSNTKIRLRPHHFPYTEPSAEVDVSCWVCGGKGCRVCKGEGWIEILGSGMVHPTVLENCGIDSTVYSGFAFGIGIERTAMGHFGVDDIRQFYEDDIRFLKQF